MVKTLRLQAKIATPFAAALSIREVAKKSRFCKENLGETKIPTLIREKAERQFSKHIRFFSMGIPPVDEIFSFGKIMRGKNPRQATLSKLGANRIATGKRTEAVKDKLGHSVGPKDVEYLVDILDKL